ncbi:hypothetical protein BDV93DRAFT_116041 [Ceratobasidium sp. AG-I]|nr:hypothetical protein BDV93DRAFT_116041 [Ceratobasidium sp. AG-I]
MPHRFDRSTILELKMGNDAQWAPRYKPDGRGELRSSYHHTTLQPLCFDRPICKHFPYGPRRQTSNGVVVWFGRSCRRRRRRSSSHNSKYDVRGRRDRPSCCFCERTSQCTLGMIICILNVSLFCVALYSELGLTQCSHLIQVAP